MIDNHILDDSKLKSQPKVNVTVPIMPISYLKDVSGLVRVATIDDKITVPNYA